jgi:hypothetical protein
MLLSLGGYCYGLAKTHLHHLLTAVALNVVRLGAWWLETPPAKTRVTPFAALRGPSPPLTAPAGVCSPQHPAAAAAGGSSFRITGLIEQDAEANTVGIEGGGCVVRREQHQ